MSISIFCSICRQLLVRRSGRGMPRTVKTVGTCCAGKVGLPAHAAQPVLQRREGDRRRVA